MTRTLFFILCILFSVICYSQNWVVLHENENLKIEMDTTEMGYDYGCYCIWFRNTRKTKQAREQYVRNQLIFLKGMRINSDVGKWVNYSYSIGYVLYDCNKKKTGAISLIDFNDSKEAIERINFEYKDIIWQYVVPHSIEWQIMDILCKETKLYIE